MPGSLDGGENVGVRFVHVRAALAGLIFAAPAFVVLLASGWLDERGEGMTPNVEPPDLPDALHVALVVVAAVVLVGSPAIGGS